MERWRRQWHSGTVIGTETEIKVTGNKRHLIDYLRNILMTTKGQHLIRTFVRILYCIVFIKNNALALGKQIRDIHFRGW